MKAQEPNLLNILSSLTYVLKRCRFIEGARVVLSRDTSVQYYFRHTKLELGLRESDSQFLASNPSGNLIVPFSVFDGFRIVGTSAQITHSVTLFMWNPAEVGSGVVVGLELIKPGSYKLVPPGIWCAFSTNVPVEISIFEHSFSESSLIRHTSDVDTLLLNTH